jgi:AmiR/NasT family two-component response regulator
MPETRQQSRSGSRLDYLGADMTEAPSEGALVGTLTSVQQLRVLIANERLDRLEILARVITELGHSVIARETLVTEVGAATARARPDVAIVGLGVSPLHALDLISEIVREAYCPVIAVTHRHDPDWVNEAAKRGVYAYIIDGHAEELQSAMDITLRRFAEYQNLHGAFERGNAASLREQEFARLRQRDALELHDGVVQGLAVAHLALELDHTEQSREALLATLSQAKSIVARAVEELKESGVSQEQLVRAAAGHRADG